MIPRKALLWQFIRSVERSYQEDTSVLDRVMDIYGLGRNWKYRPAGDGLSSKTYVVLNKRDKWVLKQYRKQIQPQEILFIHSLLIQLEQQGFPASHLNITPDGQNYVMIDGCCYALFNYALGYRADLFRMIQPLRHQYNRQAGIALARFHRLTKNMLLQGARKQGYKTAESHERWDSYADYPGEWSALVTQAFQSRNREALTPNAVSKYIANKMANLAETENERPFLPISVTHGDYGPWNLLFRPFAVLNSVIDFDDASLEERIEEVAASIIAFTQDRSSNRVNIDDGLVFLRSYHQESPLTYDELHALPDVLERFLLKKILTISKMYVQFQQTADYQKLLNVIFWLKWLDNTGFDILPKLTSPILDHMVSS